MGCVKGVRVYAGNSLRDLKGEDMRKASLPLLAIFDKVK